MQIRSLILGMLLVAGPLQAADSDAPLAKELGQHRPVIVIAPSTLDPTLVKLQKALEEPANRQAFDERNMVLYTVVNTIGQRDGKYLEPQTTMALIRQLKLGASADTKVIVVGKDGEKRLEHSGPIDPKDLFSAIDQFPDSEKTAAAPVAAEPASPVAPGKKPTKPGKQPQQLDD